MKKVQLGDIARDTITGFQGVVVGRTSFLANVDRIVINPQQVKDGKPIENRSFDETDVEFVSRSNVRIIPVERTKVPVSVGDEVRDQVSGVVGVVKYLTIWLEGCCTMGVQPKDLKDGVPVDIVALDERMVDIVKQKTPPAPKVRTGGPRSEPARVKR